MITRWSRWRRRLPAVNTFRAMSTHAANSRSAPTAPTTLEDALARIRDLEDTLETARQIWRAEGKGDLDEAVRRYRSAGQANETGQASSSTAATPSSCSSTRDPYSFDASVTPSEPEPSSESDAPLVDSGDTSPSAPEPVDIGPFVLLALALRKQTQIGSIDEDKVEEKFEAIVEGTGLSEEQVQTLRQWAGL